MHNTSKFLYLIYVTMLVCLGCSNIPKYTTFIVVRNGIVYDALGLIKDDKIDTIFISKNSSYTEEAYNYRNIRRSIGVSCTTPVRYLDSLIKKSTYYKNLPTESSHSEMVAFLLNSKRISNPDEALKIILQNSNLERLDDVKIQTEFKKIYNDYRLNKIGSLMQKIDCNVNHHQEFISIMDKDTIYLLEEFSYGVALKNAETLQIILSELNTKGQPKNQTHYYVDMYSFQNGPNSKGYDYSYSSNYLFFKFEITCDERHHWTVNRSILNPTGVL